MGDNKYFVAHNEYYEQVLVPKRPELMGKMFTVKIVDSCKFSMTGEIVDPSSVIRPSLADPLEQGQVSGAGENLSVSSSDKNYKLYVTSFVMLVIAVIFRLFIIYFCDKIYRISFQK